MLQLDTLYDFLWESIHRVNGAEPCIAHQAEASDAKEGVEDINLILWTVRNASLLRVLQT